MKNNFFHRLRALLSPNAPLFGRAGLHERRIATQFAGRCRFAGDAPVFARRLILLGFTNRSGSTLLAEYLRQSGRVAGGMELLNHDIVATQVASHPADDFPVYITGLVHRLGGDDGDAFCLKASWDQIAMLYRWNIPAMFRSTRMIHIRRADVVGQAVSHAIADQTKSWTSQQHAAGITPVFDARRIGAIIARQARAHDAIALAAQVLDVPCVDITYEQLATAPTLHVQRVLGACGVDVAPGWQVRATVLQKQATAVNAGFAARYRAILRSSLTG